MGISFIEKHRYQHYYMHNVCFSNRNIEKRAHLQNQFGLSTLVKNLGILEIYGSGKREMSWSKLLNIPR